MKKETKKTSQKSKSTGFSMFTDEESKSNRGGGMTGASTTNSSFNIFKRAATPPPKPAKKTLGSKVKGFFGMGKKTAEPISAR